MRLARWGRHRRPKEGELGLASGWGGEASPGARPYSGVGGLWWFKQSYKFLKKKPAQSQIRLPLHFARDEVV